MAAFRRALRALDSGHLLGLVLIAGCSACGSAGATSSTLGDAGEAGDAAGISCQHVSVRARCKDELCLVPAGCFLRGSPPSEPYRGRYNEEQYEVTLTRSFVMQDHETTRAEWASAGFRNIELPETVQQGTGEACTEPGCPAVRMTWFGAVAYANEKSKREGLPSCIELLDCTGEPDSNYRCAKYRQTTSSYYECTGYRVPTMFEFEYAKKAGTTTAFYTGPFEPASDQCIDVPHLNDHAWYCVNAEGRSHPVKQKLPNPWGLHDMMGNVFEYVSSNTSVFSLTPSAVRDPGAVLDAARFIGVADGPAFAWPGLLRSSAMPEAYMLDAPAMTGGVNLGFRLVRTVSTAEAEAW